MSGTTLSGRRIAITGRLCAMTRDAAAEAIGEHGGTFVSSVSRKTEVLVVGQEGSPLAGDGGLTGKLLRARELVEQGHALEIVSEDDFLAALGHEREERLYTVTQLSRLLGVSGARLRSWVRKGLIRPQRTANRLSYFEFQGVSAAKEVAELVQKGVSPERIRASLAELAEWFPAAGTAFRECALEQLGSDLVARLGDGRIAEPGGQLCFDFQRPTPVRTIRPPPRELTAEDWVDRGLEREDLGDPRAAAAAYETAIGLNALLPEARFNLGNVLYHLGDAEAASERFLEAVGLDPSYVEAWNNLGTALADTGRQGEATRAYRRALALEPGYADAHFNLAETLHQMGELEAARSHFRSYLAQDPASDWADQARERLLNR